MAIPVLASLSWWEAHGVRPQMVCALPRQDDAAGPEGQRASASPSAAKESGKGES